MQKAMSTFIVALRQAGLPISQAETLDALRAAQITGISDRQQLKTSLALTLSKSLPHQEILEEMFDQYFVEPDSARLTDEPDEPDESPADAPADLPQGDGASSEPPPEAAAFSPESNLAKQLMSGDGDGIAVAMVAAAQDLNLSDINVFTQKNLFSFRIMQQLGDEALLADINRMANTPVGPKQRLQEKREQLREQVRDFVEQQFLVHAKNKGLKLRESFLQGVKLSNVEFHDYARMSELVRKAARKLASQHSRRKKVSKRGMLDVRKTLAANAAFDGVQFHTRWKATKVDRPKIIALCDVSGSVSRVARFLLLFLYSLQDVLPKVRSFAFASNTLEVSELFEQKTVAEAVAEILQIMGNMSSNYGSSLEDFQAQALRQIDNKTTVIMLGDARNNNADGRGDIWQQVYRQSRRVLWLNPENERSWNTGDSIMSSYTPYCSQVEPCQTLDDLNRILSRLLKYS